MEGADGKKGGGRGAEEERKKKEKVPFLKLFTFADFWDYVLMGIGSLGACAHGASVPVFFIFFGKLINIMGVAYLFPQSVSDKVGKYSLDFVYLSIVVLFSFSEHGYGMSWGVASCVTFWVEDRTPSAVCPLCFEVKYFITVWL